MPVNSVILSFSLTYGNISSMQQSTGTYVFV